VRYADVLREGRHRNYYLAANPPLFRPPIETPAGGTESFDVAIGRFTKLPIPDVVVPNTNSDNVSPR